MAGTPPITVDGEMVRLRSVGFPPPATGLSVSPAETLFDAVAVIVAVVDESTGSVAIGKLVEVCPAEITTEG